MKATGSRPPRPTPADLAAARDKTLADVAAPGLRVLFSGINPGLYSAATGHHFARPGNRFWPALHRSGFTPRLLCPDEQEQLLDIGLGITNIVARATARADQLRPDELREGGQELAAKVGRLSPRWLAIVGVTAYRTAFGRPGASVGPQDQTLGRTRVWVLPNPSGLNAHWSAESLAGEFARLRAAADGAAADRAATDSAAADSAAADSAASDSARLRAAADSAGPEPSGTSQLPW